MTTTPFLMSVEETAGRAVRNGFHLGTDERVARSICMDRYHGRANAGLPVVTVALMDGAGKMLDVYYGTSWQSEFDAAEGGAL